MKKQLEVAKKLRSMLQCKQFIVTGSVALALYGLRKPETVVDLDLILINPTPEALKFLKSQQQLNPVMEDRDYEDCEQYRFWAGGTQADGGQVKVDVFIRSDERVLFLHQSENVALNPIQEILQAKREMCRLKDLIQMKEMANAIITDHEIKMGMATVEAKSRERIKALNSEIDHKEHVINHLSTPQEHRNEKEQEGKSCMVFAVVDAAKAGYNRNPGIRRHPEEE